MQVSLKGRTAVVTGAGGGLGRAYALELARRGAHVVVNDIGGGLTGEGKDQSPARAVVAEIEAAGGSAVASFDSVTTPEGGQAIVARALDAFGSLDVLVNNAGILRDRSIAKFDWDDVGAVLDVHLKGALFVTQPAFHAMRESGHGRILFCSSNAGTFGNFGQAAYGAAKAAVIGFSNVLSIEGARHGITSNVVCPLARTRMTEQMLGDLAGALSPQSVAPLVAYLASDECTLTHRVFSAGGGHYSRVFTGLTQGWQAPPGAGAEEIAAHLAEIEDTDGFGIPLSASEELTALRAQLTGAGILEEGADR